MRFDWEICLSRNQGLCDESWERSFTLSTSPDMMMKKVSPGSPCLYISSPSLIEIGFRAFAKLHTCTHQGGQARKCHLLSAFVAICMSSVEGTSMDVSELKSGTPMRVCSSSTSSMALQRLSSETAEEGPGMWGSTAPLLSFDVVSGWVEQKACPPVELFELPWRKFPLLDDVSLDIRHLHRQFPIIAPWVSAGAACEKSQLSGIIKAT